jgi:cysteine-rich repeat protein
LKRILSIALALLTSTIPFQAFPNGTKYARFLQGTITKDATSVYDDTLHCSNVDTDGDGTLDCKDKCPSDPNKIEPGLAGCGLPEPFNCAVQDLQTLTVGQKTMVSADTSQGSFAGSKVTRFFGGIVAKIAPSVYDSWFCHSTDTDGDGVLDCNDGCPTDPHKTAPGITGCGFSEPVVGTVQDLHALVLTLGVVSFTVPAKALPAGVKVCLSSQLTNVSDFTAAPGEASLFPVIGNTPVPAAKVIKLNFSQSLRAQNKTQMTLRVPIPDSAGPYFYAYIKTIGAPPFGSEFSGTTGWSLAAGRFDPATRILSLPFMTTAQEILVMLVGKNPESAFLKTDPPNPLLGIRNLIRGLGPLIPEANAQEAVCGNGVLDPIAGGEEECDDGNTIGGDGCDANCRTENPELENWQDYEWAVICDPPMTQSQCEPILNSLAARFKAATQRIAALGFTKAAVSRVLLADLERFGLTLGTSGSSPTGEYLVAHLVPTGALDGDGGVEGVLGIYYPVFNKMSVVEGVLSADALISGLPLGDFVITHELFHAVQVSEIPSVESLWITEGTADAAAAATLIDSYPARRAFRLSLFNAWRDWQSTLNSKARPDPYQTVEFWFELADGDLSYLNGLFVQLNGVSGLSEDGTTDTTINEENDYPFVDGALALLNIVPDIDPNLSALPDAYLDLIQVRDSQIEYPYCLQTSCTIGQDCANPPLQSLPGMSGMCIKREIRPTCPVSVGTKQITLQVAAGDPNVWRLMLDGVLHPANTPVSFENNNPRIWVINTEMDGNASAGFTIPITANDYPTCVCGDGLVGPGEACDDGNTVNEDGCTNACTLPACGDGIVQAGEACDDGNTVNGDGCTNACTLPACGDGIVQAGEACDDGNTVNNDGCTNTCTLPVCGDGVCNSGVEACANCPADCGPCTSCDQLAGYTKWTTSAVGNPCRDYICDCPGGTDCHWAALVEGHCCTNGLNNSPGFYAAGSGCYRNFGTTLPTYTSADGSEHCQDMFNSTNTNSYWWCTRTCTSYFNWEITSGPTVKWATFENGWTGPTDADGQGTSCY